MAKHMSKAALHSIGEQRVRTLTELSIESVREGRDDRAKRYVDIALRICGKTRMRMPEEFRYCKACHLPLIPGVNCKVRLTGHKVVMACPCGSVRRRPYLREQRQ